MPRSTTIYSGWGWDEVTASAILATALLRKGYRIYVEFPSPSERKGLAITKSYAVGISQKDGVILRDSISIQYIPEKRLGVVLKYDSTGKSDLIMRFSNVGSLSATMLEYVETLNERVNIPEQVLCDIEAINTGEYDKVSKLGRVMLRALKVNYNSKEFRQLMYTFMMEVLRTKTLRPSEELLKENEKYDKAMELAEKILENREYIQYDKLKVIVISSKFNRELIKVNYPLLKPVTYDILMKVCKKDGVAILVQETELGHTIRVCLYRRDVSFVKVISAIPKEMSEKLNIILRGNHIIIKFRNPQESTLNNVLDVVDIIANAIVTQLRTTEQQRKPRKR